MFTLNPAKCTSKFKIVPPDSGKFNDSIWVLTCYSPRKENLFVFDIPPIFSSILYNMLVNKPNVKTVYQKGHCSILL